MAHGRHESLITAVDRQAAGGPPPPGAGIFGASPEPEECSLILLPVRWDVTTSYGQGAARGPEAIVGASHQLDLEDSFFERPYEAGIAMVGAPEWIISQNIALRSKAKSVITSLENGEPCDQRVLAEINDCCRNLNQWVYEQSLLHLKQGRLVGVVGGDHSVPYGLIKALHTRYGSEGFGILHCDAHLDLRSAYEGFEHSHASIMFNVTEDFEHVSPLVQVGIRDYSQEEVRRAATLKERHQGFYDHQLKRAQFEGVPWQTTVAKIVEGLPTNVYISFDIDGLNPACCPNTGTPVPGGLLFNEAVYLIEQLASSGRRVVGFDLCEVSPGGDEGSAGEWDANVGARILYKLCGAALHTNGKCLLV